MLEEETGEFEGVGLGEVLGLLDHVFGEEAERYYGEGDREDDRHTHFWHLGLELV